MSEWGVRFIEFTNLSPVFKGGSVALVGLVALLFAFWMNKRWREPRKGGFLVFIGVAAFVALYGLFVLIFQPQWWKLPY
ncbi:hypothetical protein A2625_07055 [candidate division WOR-1 bacterium RIFCSPHIGHO2_01_FULL_53_15]|uniref:DUF5658 domain-containing protein n=1 Tax=candidate division WOR-1 bacterium RIFCSPHIGHO2_01_FULL_53_15 TaxID=1802564 RepID=A0A1F4Q4C5_UNCSA|nr:MAG: hypothetical protein A2625_07055 [candidate division WOR-1 bacterium RIFCSPHIGHO2_01_FULL_53_15]OGC13245.1 MAG: hypothetical protein A3D23_01305 [candidate division WOR-1 bacterium RIFCSPHIGHO2_02_FULL_53_26]